jgi:caffeoyl-CoA O-methyltransferase
MNDRLEHYCMTHTQAESPCLQALREYTAAHCHSPHMLSDRLVGRCLQFYVRLLAATQVVDLGTYTGYSALSLAEALPPAGKVITCDKDPRVLEIARSFFNQSPAGSKINLFEGEVSACLNNLTTPVDLMFIDADKMQTATYYEQALPHIRPGGMIIIDDVLWRGEVLNPIDKRAILLDQFNKSILKDTRVTNMLLPIRHGLNIIVKL